MPKLSEFMEYRELELPKVVPAHACVGMRIKYIKDGEIYILAQTRPFHVSAINLGTGNRYQDGVKVGNINRLTKKEISAIIGNTGLDKWEFTYDTK